MMRMIMAAFGLVGIATGLVHAQGPMPAKRITPAMMAELKRDYPAATYECFEKVLPKALASEFEYIFTYDYRLGQLWLISFAALDDAPAEPFICTPAGYAETPEEMIGAVMADQAGMPQ